METITFLPLVKAYPALSRKYGEVSCVAGVRIDNPRGPTWIRLYPVPFRALSSDKQFAKYQPISVKVATHGGDRRPETRRPDCDSIEKLGKPLPTTDAWQARRRFVEPLMAGSMCEILRRQESDGISLGVFRPRRVHDIVIEAVDIEQEKVEIARAWAAQGSLLEGVEQDERRCQRQALKQVPWRFRYRYECDEPGCKGHTQSIVDWEIARTYFRVQGRDDWRERLRQRWLHELCAPDRDTAFFVGNMHQYLRSFLVLGVWWPPRRAEQLVLDGLA